MRDRRRPGRLRAVDRRVHPGPAERRRRPAARRPARTASIAVRRRSTTTTRRWRPSPYSRAAIDTDLAREVWDAALATSWDRPPVWFHGDIASGNLLVQDGRLSAVIDFGTSGVGDPACDLVIAYTFFIRPSREAFRDDGRAGRRRPGPVPAAGRSEGPHHQGLPVMNASSMTTCTRTHVTPSYSADRGGAGLQSRTSGLAPQTSHAAERSSGANSLRRVLLTTYFGSEFIRAVYGRRVGDLRPVPRERLVRPAPNNSPSARSSQSEARTKFVQRARSQPPR